MVKQSKLMLCCDCGYAVDKDKMFVKQYQSTAICLCKTCAMKLQQDIAEKYGYNEAVDKPMLYDWYLNSVSPEDKPVWTEAHIDELLRDFYLIPKNA